MAVSDDRSDVKQTTTGFRGPLMVQSLTSAKSKFLSLPFAIRVGIATGYAKVGNIGPRNKIDYTVIGGVVNLSSRLQSFGQPGDVVIDEETLFFVKDDYQIFDLGGQELKGFSEPVKVYTASEKPGT